MPNFSSNPPQLGYFLDFSIWREGKKLLDFQTQQLDKNQHYKTLSMFYYKRINRYTNSLAKEKYFQERIANNLFYGLESEFAVYDYVIPKSHLRIRNYKFFTYPMRVLYYSIGIYLIKLSQDALQSYVNKNERFKCYYGGNLRFNKESLVINHETTYYKKNYKEFKKCIRKQVNKEIDNKLVIKLDIQNYFDDVCMPILLDEINNLSKPSVKEELRFDTLTREQINFYFDYLSGNKGGIPQTDNDIISGFLGHLYLTFSDLAIDTEICRHKNFIKEHQIMRFVDDIFIVINFVENIEKDKKEVIADLLTSRMSDILHYQLKLRLNTKTRLYWLNNRDQKEELLKDLKKVSPDYYANDDDREETPENKIINIFRELENLKKSGIDCSVFSDGSLQEEIIKEVYDKSVNQLLNKQENQNKIEKIFTEFNFDLVKAMPREIIVIISKNGQILEQFVNFLCNKEVLTTRDLYLVIKFLCQTDFANKKTTLFKKLKSHPEFKDIAIVYEKRINFNYPGYYNLSHKQLDVLVKEAHIIEQIRLRIFNETLGYYSVALNHLLNEIHAICMLLDKNKTELNKNKEYKADDVVKYLTSQCVPHETCIDIRNLFDRRNRNMVSHPGSDQNMAWGVTKNEYIRYRQAIGKCLETILN